MSKKILLYSLSLLFLTSLVPHSDAMVMDGGNHMQATQNLCAICYTPKSVDQFISLACGHRFCKECLARSIDMVLQNQSTNNLRCYSCWTHLITQEEIAQIATPSQQEKLGVIQLKEWLAKQSQVKYCPTPDCTYAFINADTCQSNTECPKCHKVYCNQCMTKHPEYMSCHAAKDQLASPDEKANKKWVELHSKPCPQCHAAIEKNFGCDHMTCSKCRYEFCWKCLRKYPCPDGYLCHEPEQPIVLENVIRPRAPIVARRTLDERAQLNAAIEDWDRRYRLLPAELQQQFIDRTNFTQIGQYGPTMADAVRLTEPVLTQLENEHNQNIERRIRRLNFAQQQEFNRNVQARDNNNDRAQNLRNQWEELERQNSLPADIEVRADMPRDFHGFARMLTQAGIRIHINANGTLRITARMGWDTFNRILEQANALFR